MGRRGRAGDVAWVVGLVGAAAAVYFGADYLENLGDTPAPEPTTAKLRTSEYVPPPVPDAEYRAMLTTLDGTLRAGVQRIAAAESMDDLAAMRGLIADAVEAERVRFEAVGAPGGVDRRQLLFTLGETVKRARTFDFDSHPRDCGPASIRDVAQARYAFSVTFTVPTSTFLDGLEKAGFGSGGVDALPMPQRPDRAPTTGTVVSRTEQRGAGRLRIVNNTLSDTAVSIVEGDPTKPQLVVYVRGESTATVTGIADPYELHYRGGANWDPGQGSFTQFCTFQKVALPFPADSSWQISLKPTAEGNAPTSAVEPY